MSSADLLPTIETGVDEEQTALLKTLLATMQHFFGSFRDVFARVHDPRQPELITYPLPACISLPRPVSTSC